MTEADLSRLGRNSTMTGMFINFTFAKHEVRYIAINDNFDSDNPNSTDFDFAGIRMWFNEFYAKDTSKKIRAVNKAKGERGEPLTTNPPYGYTKDPEDKKHWIIDPEAAEVVRRIFKLCMEGKGPSQIADILTKDKILNPTNYQLSKGRNVPNHKQDDPYFWSAPAIAYILEQRAYTGCIVNFKTYTKSLWDKKTRANDPDNILIFPDRHEAIISEDEFNTVQEIRKHRHRRIKSGKTNMFSGLVFCGDCGSRLYFSTSTKFKDSQDYFVCGTHRKNKKCSSHYIRAVVLEQLVWMHMKEVISYVTQHEEYFRKQVEEELQIQSAEKRKLIDSQLTEKTKRIKELDFLITKLYEANAHGKLSDERFTIMMESYENEQKDLKDGVDSLNRQLQLQDEQSKSIEQFIEKVKQYSDLRELTPYALHDLIKGIYIYETITEGKRIREKSLKIRYDISEDIDLDKLMNA